MIDAGVIDGSPVSWLSLQARQWPSGETSYRRLARRHRTSTSWTNLYCRSLRRSKPLTYACYVIFSVRPRSLTISASNVTCSPPGSGCRYPPWYVVLWKADLFGFSPVPICGLVHRGRLIPDCNGSAQVHLTYSGSDIL